MFYIYGLFDPITNELRYIGQTINSLEERLRGHLKAPLSENSHKYKWIQKLKRFGLCPYIQIIQIFKNIYLEDFNKAEIYWIKYFKNNGCNLINIMEGGNRPPNIKGRKVSNLTKEKISKAHLGVKETPEARKNMSLGQLGRKHPLEYKILQSQIHGGKIFYCIENKKEYSTLYQASLDLGISKSSISQILHKTMKVATSKKDKKLYSFIYKDSVMRFDDLEILKNEIELYKNKRNVPNIKPIIDQNGVIYKTLEDACKKLKIHSPNISQILHGKRKTTRGHTFRYLTDAEIKEFNNV